MPEMTAPADAGKTGGEADPPPQVSSPSVETAPSAPGEEILLPPLDLAATSSGPIDQRQLLSMPLKLVGVARIGGYWVTHGDILLMPGKIDERFGDENRRLASLTGVAYWPGGVIPYVIDSKLQAKARVIEDAINDFMAATPVSFVGRAPEDENYLHFVATTELNCASYLGMTGGRQEILIAGDCGKGQILHELMHALGFAHEQSRADRDEHVDILWDNIEAGRYIQFQKLDAAISQPVHVPFDFASILMYPSTAFSRNDGPTMLTKEGDSFEANRQSLSDSDVERIERLYGGMP